MSYLVLARKYRPKTFDDIVGQEHIVTTLKNAIRSDHIAHAYLFAGPRGVGKTSMARILSKALNCHNGMTVSPCNECDICRCIANGNDIDVLEIDGASNRGIDSIRDLRQNVKYAPGRSRFKVYIIDEVHMLTDQAFNALLKTLEEPPSHVKFIFATTDAEKLPETVQSRCQRFDFRNVTTADIIKRLASICHEEGILVEQSALETIATNARGGLRDSQSLLDQLIAYSTDKITLKDVYTILGTVEEGKILQLVHSMLNKDTRTALQITHEAISNGKNVVGLIDQLLWHLRNLLIVHTCGIESSILTNLPDGVRTFYKSTWEEATQAHNADGPGADCISPETFIYMIHVLSETKRRARDDLLERILFESAMIRLTTMQDLRPLNEVLERLEALEKKLGQETGLKTQGDSFTRNIQEPRLDVQDPVPAAQDPPPTMPSHPEPHQEKQAAPADASIADIWKNLNALVQSRKRSTWSLLHHGEPISIENGEAVIGFPKKIYKEQLELPNEKSLIEQCVEEILGRKIRIKMVLLKSKRTEPIHSENKIDSTPPPTTQPSSTRVGKLPEVAESEPMVKQVLEFFGGSRVVNVRRQGK